MTLTLAAAGTIAGVAGSATAVTYTIFGDEVAATDAFKKLAQGQLPNAATVLYTAPVATQAIIKTIILVNTTGAGVAITMYVDGTAAANSIGAFTIPAGGQAHWTSQGWSVRDANGAVLGTTNVTLTGDVTGTGTGSVPTTLATVNANVGSFGSASSVAAFTVNAKGLTTAASAIPIVIAESAVTNLVSDLAGKQPTGNYITSLTTDVTAAGPGAAAATLATVNANVGTFGTASNVMSQTVNAKGLTTAASNVPIVIAESAVTNLVTDLAGKQATGNYITALTGDVTATGPGSVAGTLATVNGNVGSFGTASNVAQFTVNAKGLTTAAANVPIAIAESAVTNLVSDLAAKVGSTRNINTTAPLTGGGDLSADRTLAISAATTAAAGSMSALDKQKLDNLWIDVTANPTALVLAGNTAAQNVTAINAILAAAPAGSVIYFPSGTYSFNTAWTMPAAKQFTFQGHGPGLSGGNSLLQWTSNVAGTWITLASSTFYYYFYNLTFVSTGVTQTAGAVVDVNGNATTNFYNCHFTGLSGGFLNDVLVGTNTGFGQSWNSSVVSDCIMSSYKGRGIFIDSAGASLTVANSVIQGAWGGFTGAPASLQALAGVQANNCGALQINDCDILGNINNLLLSPATSQVNASCFMTNTYLDNSGGSCFKIAGAGATVRVRFDTCSFTTAGTNYTTAGTNFSAVENAGTFTFAAGGQSIGFTNCNILNTFGTTGTTNGVLLGGTWADWYFTNNNVAGWTNGFNSTPSGTNICMLKVGLGAVGPSAGYGANTTGFNIAAGSYKGLMIQGVNAHGNTTNLTLGAVTVAAADASLFRIIDNSGINPRGAVTTPGVPVAAAVVTNTTGFRVLAMCKTGATAYTAVVINGVTCGAGLANGHVPITLEPGGTVSFTTTTVASWVWVGL